VRAATEDQLAAFDRVLAEALAPARAAGDLALVELAPYLPEIGRYGATALPALEALWQADSELACDLLAADDATPLVEHLVATFDALAAALGLTLSDRAALSTARAVTYASELAALRDEEGRDLVAAEFRARQAQLRARLEAAPAARDVRYAHEIAAAAAPLSASQRRTLLPSLLHLSAVRLMGSDRLLEIRALALWQRALAGRLARARRPPT
jgi:thiopeptide-type bacteriocin biosynthesis protein